MYNYIFERFKEMTKEEKIKYLKQIYDGVYQILPPKKAPVS